MQNFQIIVVDDRNVMDAIGNMGFSLSEVFVRECGSPISDFAHHNRFGKKGLAE